MAKESTIIATEIFMREIGKMGKNLGGEPTSVYMDTHTKENGNKGSKMEKELKFGEKEANGKVKNMKDKC